MKKIKKVIAVFLMIASLLSLASCTSLEEMREQHVTYSKDSKDVLFYLGNKYLPIELTGYDYVGYQYGDILGVLTEYDVPVLLSQSSNIFFTRGSVRINLTKTMIFVGDEAHVSDARWFLREDIYEEYKQKGFEAFFCGYYVNSYLKYEEEAGTLLSKECADAVRETLNSAQIQEKLEQHACVGSLNRCDEKGEMRLFIGSIFRSEAGDYYFETVSDIRYKVPQKYNSLFDAIFE